jgi:probable HAF family extracellular repeat protein
VFTDVTGLTALPGLPLRPRTLARDINDLGDIVGSANAGGSDLGHAVIWSSGYVRDLGTLGAGSSSEAQGINNLGQVVGWSATNGGSVHAFLSTAAGLVDLTPDSDTGYATDINDAGQITGYKTAYGGYHAFRWHDGTFTDLGVLPGFADSFGWAINAAGTVAGSSSSASGNSERMFRSSAGGLLDLGGTGEHNVALGINLSGVVVGMSGASAKRAQRYTDADGLRDLNTLIDPSLGWVLLAAYDVNDAGQIVGYASNNFTGQKHAVRLQPVTQLPGCTFHCLRVTGIQLTATSQRLRRSIKGSVTVRDEKGAALPNALIVGRWTLPDGSTQEQYGWTSSTGIASFATSGPVGTYTFTIVNALLSLYTYDVQESILSKSINVLK